MRRTPGRDGLPSLGIDCVFLTAPVTPLRIYNSFALTTHAAPGLLQQQLPQQGVRSRGWDQASGPALQKQLVVRHKRLSCGASLVAAGVESTAIH